MYVLEKMFQAYNEKNMDYLSKESSTYIQEQETRKSTYGYLKNFSYGEK